MKNLVNDYIYTTLNFFDTANEIFKDILEDKATFDEGKYRVESLLANYPKAEQIRKMRATITGTSQYLLSIKNHIKEESYLFKKFIKFLISLNNPDVIDSLETHYLSERNPKGFLIFLDELQRANKDTSSAFKTFLKLIRVNAAKPITINQVASILGKEKSFIIESLIDNAYYECLHHYINESFRDDLDFSDADIKAFASVVKSKKDNFDSLQYVITSSLLMSYSIETFPIFLESELDYCEIEEYVTNYSVNFFRYIDFLKNYGSFVSQEKLLSFEKKILSKVTSPSFILNYAKYVEKSTKRNVLKRLFELKKVGNYDGYIIDFLKHFPQYNHLLVML